MNTISTAMADETSPKKALVITSSGGGGLLQAAIAKEEEIQKRYPGIEILKVDLLKEWVWKWAGRLGIRWWDEAQQMGDVKKLQRIIDMQVYAELLFFPWVFSSVLKTLFQQNIDLVIDTQPVGTSAILKALRIYNKVRKRDVCLQKVCVDLPTKKSTHFFHSIKKLSRKDKRQLRLVTIEPLLENGETEEQFWLKNCGIPIKDIAYEDYYIRQSFKKYQGQPKPEEKFPLRVRFPIAEDKSRITKTFQMGPIQAHDLGEFIEFEVGKSDKVMTILLGSQPAFQATLEYIQHTIQLLKKIKIPTNFYLFVFCAAQQDSEKSLFQKVYDVCSQTKDYPKNLSVVPMSFQSAEIIAPLFYRTDISLTRSGGQTAMELMSVSNGDIWIHSESKCNSLDEPDESLLSGIPGWEAGNACYLRDKFGAKIVAPGTMSFYLETYLKSCQS